MAKGDSRRGRWQRVTQGEPDGKGWLKESLLAKGDSRRAKWLRVTQGESVGKG